MTPARFLLAAVAGSVIGVVLIDAGCRAYERHHGVA